MSNKISINLQAISPTQAMYHSLRETKISYLIDAPYTRTLLNNDVKIPATKYRNLGENSMTYPREKIHPINKYFNARQKEINADYKKTHNNSGLQKNTKLYQEAVISFGREQFEKCKIEEIEDKLKSFCSTFSENTGSKIVFSSLHLDEGHIEDGEKLHNYHAHILIENYNFETHKTCLQKLDYRKLQGLVAECFKDLGFERGDPEKKTQRLEHKQYREVKENEKLNIKEIDKYFLPISELTERLEIDCENVEEFTNEIENIINEKIAENLELKQELRTKDQIIDEFYEKINHLEAEKIQDIEGKNQIINQLKADYESTRTELKTLKAQGLEPAKQAEYTQLKKEYEQAKKTIQEQKTEINDQIDQINALEMTLEEQNELLTNVGFEPTEIKTPTRDTAILLSRSLDACSNRNHTETIKEALQNAQNPQKTPVIDIEIGYEELICRSKAILEISETQNNLEKQYKDQIKPYTREYNDIKNSQKRAIKDVWNLPPNKKIAELPDHEHPFKRFLKWCRDLFIKREQERSYDII